MLVASYYNGGFNYILAGEYYNVITQHITKVIKDDVDVFA